MCIFKVSIYILNVNDNSPIFQVPLYSAFVKEDVAIGSTILKVFFSPNSILIYIKYKLRKENISIEYF